jgi:hypothetical protein
MADARDRSPRSILGPEGVSSQTEWFQAESMAEPRTK